MNKEEALRLAVQIDTSNDINQIFDLTNKILDFVQQPVSQISKLPTTLRAIAEITFGISPYGQSTSHSIRPNQEEILSFFETGNSGLIAAHRQFGKTAISCLYALHILFNTTNQLVMCTNSHSSAMALKERVEWLVDYFDLAASKKTNTLRARGSVIFVTPSNAEMYMNTQSILLVDEAAFISFSSEKLLMKAKDITTNRIIYMSTPNSNESFFTKLAKELVENPQPNFDLIVRTADISEIPQTLRKALGAEQIDREFTLESFKKFIGL